MRSGQESESTSFPPPLPAANAEPYLPTVVGHGLEAIPDAINLLQNGVSATKLIVTIRTHSSGTSRPPASPVTV